MRCVTLNLFEHSLISSLESKGAIVAPWECLSSLEVAQLVVLIKEVTVLVVTLAHSKWVSTSLGLLEEDLWVSLALRSTSAISVPFAVRKGAVVAIVDLLTRSIIWEGLRLLSFIFFRLADSLILWHDSETVCSLGKERKAQ